MFEVGKKYKVSGWVFADIALKNNNSEFVLSVIESVGGENYYIFVGTKDGTGQWAADSDFAAGVAKAEEIIVPEQTFEELREEIVHEIASRIGKGTFFEDGELIFDAIVEGKIKNLKFEQ